MAYDANSYNYVTGYFKCSNTGGKYQPHGNSTDYYAWEVNFESIKTSGACILADNKEINSVDNWAVGIDSSGHPYVYWSKNSTYRYTKTYTDLTVSWNTWFSIKYIISANSANPTIQCTLNGTSKTQGVSGRWNINGSTYPHYLQIGDTNTTIRGDAIVKGYTYQSNTLYTANFNPNNFSVGATTATVDSLSYTISSAVQKYTTTYSVTYSANGGSGTVAAQTKTYNVALTLRSSGFTKTGSTLAGWNVGGTSGTAYALGGSYTANAAAVMWARWSANTYYVYYNANGGSGTAPSATSGTYGSTVKLATNAFSKTGYTQSGWQTATNGGTAYTSGGNYTFNSAASATLYAKWNVNTYTVSYNANGGSGTVTAQTGTYNSSITLRNNGFTRTGYTQSGWKTNSTATAASNAAGSAYTITAGNTLFYAHWVANTYTVSYNGNGNTGGSAATQTGTYNSSITLRNNGFTKTGYTQSGWKTNSTATAASNAAGSAYTIPSNNTLFYAHWIANKYTVSFNSNGGAGTMTAQTYTYDTSQALRSNAFTYTGKSFAGWATSSTGAVTYTNGQSVKNLTSTNNGTVTLYAIWTSNANMWVNVGGTWKEGQVYVNVGGTWKTAVGVYVNVNGTWKQV